MAAFRILKKAKLVKRMLVVAPLRVCYSVWPREVEKWSDFNHLRVEVLHGAQKEQALKRDADVYVINPEGLEWLFSNGRFKQLDADWLVIDESSKFKHTNTRRFKALKPFLTRFSRRTILTGTPAPNGLLDLFGQIYILDLGRSFTPYITRFRQEFFFPAGYGGYTWLPKADTHERIQELLKPLVLRLEARDYLELPQLVTTPTTDIVVELPPKARKIYDDLESVMLAELDNAEIVTALSAAAASMKCRQVANGGIYRQLDADPATEAERWQDIHTEKADALKDFVEGLNGKPLLVAYDFTHDRERILKVLGKDTPYIGGGVSPKRTAELEREWNKGNLPVLLGHPQAIGHGLNLQAECQHILWHSLTWDLELYEQFIQRVLRQGNPYSHVFVHHIIARGTVDEVIMRALRQKARVQNRLLSALKDYRQERAK